MNFPNLSVEIINRNLEETLSVLQGVSRYIESVFIKENLVEKEGIEVLNFLFKRYPNKRIILNISNWKENEELINSILKKTKIKFFLINADGYNKKFEKLCLFLKKKKKEIIVLGKSFDLIFLKKLKIKELFYFKPENKKKENYWNKNDWKNIKNLEKNNFDINVGNILAKDIKNILGIGLQNFVVSEEVCYSFDPIKTCKTIYSEIKKYYPKKKEN